ncbi:MAG: ATP-binding protein [Chloroflexota bacterium]
MPERMKVPTLFPTTECIDDNDYTEGEKLARRVHDSIGQPLTALKLIMERVATSPEKYSHLLKETQPLVTELQTEARQLQQTLSQSGLEPESRSPNGKKRKPTLSHIKFQHMGLAESITIPLGVSQALINILQEALTNVDLHASVEEATVKLWNTSGEILVQIKDHGTGFDPQAVKNAPGLTNMQKTAYFASGKLTIESAPGAGTVINAAFPASKRRRQTR